MNCPDRVSNVALYLFCIFLLRLRGRNLLQSLMVFLIIFQEVMGFDWLVAV